MLLKFIKIEQSNKNYSYCEYIFVAAYQCNTNKLNAFIEEKTATNFNVKARSFDFRRKNFSLFFVGKL